MNYQLDNDHNCQKCRSGKNNTCSCSNKCIEHMSTENERNRLGNSIAAIGIFSFLCVMSVIWMNIYPECQDIPIILTIIFYCASWLALYKIHDMGYFLLPIVIFLCLWCSLIYNKKGVEKQKF